MNYTELLTYCQNLAFSGKQKEEIQAALQQFCLDEEEAKRVLHTTEPFITAYKLKQQKRKETVKNMCVMSAVMGVMLCSNIWISGGWRYMLAIATIAVGVWLLKTVYFRYRCFSS